MTASQPTKRSRASWPFVAADRCARPIFPTAARPSTTTTARGRRRRAESDWLTTGPKVAEFEEAFAQAVGAREAVAVNSGTAALHAAMHALGIGPGDEVIVPCLTFAATANAVVYLGGTPVFADVDPDTLLITAESAARCLTPRHAGDRRRRLWRPGGRVRGAPRHWPPNMRCHSCPTPVTRWAGRTAVAKSARWRTSTRSASTRSSTSRRAKAA